MILKEILPKITLQSRVLQAEKVEEYNDSYLRPEELLLIHFEDRGIRTNGHYKYFIHLKSGICKQTVIVIEPLTHQSTGSTKVKEDGCGFKTKASPCDGFSSGAGYL